MFLDHVSTQGQLFQFAVGLASKVSSNKRLLQSLVSGSTRSLSVSIVELQSEQPRCESLRVFPLFGIVCAICAVCAFQSRLVHAPVVDMLGHNVAFPCVAPEEASVRNDEVK